MEWWKCIEEMGRGPVAMVGASGKTEVEAE